MQLPEVRGRITKNADLSKTNWFQVGGKAEVLFKPKDTQDLQHFLQNKTDCPITILGVGSNIIVRDGGIDGVVIKLGRGFTQLSLTAHPVLDTGPHERAPCQARGVRCVEVGAAVLDVHLATFSAQESVTGLEFMSGIPGTVGGAVAMNAGAYGAEVKDSLIKAELLDMQGNLYEFSNEELKFEYRKCGKMLEQQFIVTRAWFAVEQGEQAAIEAKIAQIKQDRESSQPIRSRTGGSTFKNPPNHKAWKLIDEAGLRGFKIGGAQVSDKHCNFLINNGDASAKDLENLIYEVQKRVEEHSAVKLHTEIRILGKKQ